MHICHNSWHAARNDVHNDSSDVRNAEAFEDVREVGDGEAVNLQSGNRERPMGCDVLSCGFSCKDIDNVMGIMENGLLGQGTDATRTHRMIYDMYNVRKDFSTLNNAPNDWRERGCSHDTLHGLLKYVQQRTRTRMMLLHSARRMTHERHTTHKDHKCW